MSVAGQMERPPQEGFWRIFAAITLLPISGADKAVLGCLADCANSKTGACWPSQETIARATGRDLRAVKRSIKNLEGTPYLQKTRRRRTSNMYELGWEAILAEFDAYKDRRANKAVKIANTRKSAGKNTDKTGDKDVTSGVTNPSLEEVSKTSPNKQNRYKEKKKRNSLKAAPQGGDEVQVLLHPPTDEVENVGAVLAQFDRTFKRDPSSIRDLEGWHSWLDERYICGDFEDRNVQRARRLSEAVYDYIEGAD